MHHGYIAQLARWTHHSTQHPPIHTPQAASAGGRPAVDQRGVFVENFDGASGPRGRLISSPEAFAHLWLARAELFQFSPCDFRPLFFPDPPATPGRAACIECACAVIRASGARLALAPGLDANVYGAFIRFCERQRVCAGDRFRAVL